MMHLYRCCIVIFVISLLNFIEICALSSPKVRSSSLSPKIGQKKPQKKAKVKSQENNVYRGNANLENNKSSADQIIRSELISKRNISVQTQLDYTRNGHGVLRSLLSKPLIQSLRSDLIKHSNDKNRILSAYKQKIIVASSDGYKIANNCKTVSECKRALRDLGVPADNLPFLQYFNCWRYLPIVEQLCKSQLMGSAAAQLLGVDEVRLYQDALFHKRREDGQTPWHSDARMAPFDTSSFITFWIPLQDIPSNGSGLMFVSKSHSDFALPYWNDFSSEEFQRLDQRYGGPDAIQHHMPLETGDVTVHSGWTLHSANSNKGSHKSLKINDRYALAISYVDSRSEVRSDVPGVGCNVRRKKGASNPKHGYKDVMEHLRDDEDRSSYADWICDVSPRTKFNHKLAPIVYSVNKSVSSFSKSNNQSRKTRQKRYERAK